MLNNGEPFFYPNEEVYNRTPNVAFLDESASLKVYEGTAIITTHRMIYQKGNYGIDIPHHYIKK
jgi:hypothetical protein